jgi:hypothetical protein
MPARLLVQYGSRIPTVIRVTVWPECMCVSVASYLCPATVQVSRNSAHVTFSARQCTLAVIFLFTKSHFWTPDGHHCTFSRVLLLLLIATRVEMHCCDVAATAYRGNAVTYSFAYVLFRTTSLWVEPPACRGGVKPPPRNSKVLKKLSQVPSSVEYTSLTT